MIVDYFRKAIIEKQIDQRRFTVKDLLDNSEKIMKISAKQLMWKKEFEIEVGKEVYILNAYLGDKNVWRLITTSDFKMNQNLFGLKIDLDNFLENKESL